MTLLAGWRKTAVLLAGGFALLVALAFILGGSGSSTSGGGAGESGGASSSGSTTAAPARVFGSTHGSVATAPRAAPTAGGSVSLSAARSTVSDADAISPVDVTATRVVKTGDLSLQVRRGLVQTTITKLTELNARLGGYVSESQTDNVVGSPSGEIVLRMPVGRFDAAVTGAEGLGRTVSLTTNAHDVTGKYVDLNARLAALRRTRQTYLTILGRAATIGSTLEVQQHIDDVQQQIEQIQGQLKVLRNQSADGTLTVDVSQLGSAQAPAHHHNRSGIGKAWHTSISRFARGFDAIVAALGPLVLALLVLAALALAGRLGYRGLRRAAG